MGQVEEKIVNEIEGKESSSDEDFDAEEEKIVECRVPTEEDKKIFEDNGSPSLKRKIEDDDDFALDDDDDESDDDLPIPSKIKKMDEDEEDDDEEEDVMDETEESTPEEKVEDKKVEAENVISEHEKEPVVALEQPEVKPDPIVEPK